ncbi:MAG: DUF2946 family protein [Methylocella sp.]
MARRSAQKRFVLRRAMVRPPRAGHAVFWFAAFVALCSQLFTAGFHCRPTRYADIAVVHSASGDGALAGLPCPHHAASVETTPDGGLPKDKDSNECCPLCGTLRFASNLPALDALILPDGATPAPVQFELTHLALRPPPHSGQPRAPPVSI